MRAVVLVMLVACTESSGERHVEVATFPAVPVPDLDLLFVIDNSGSTAQWQLNLGRGVPALVDALTIDGARPNLHIGIVDTDVGTASSSDFEDPAAPIGTLGQGGCAGQGDGGLLKKYLLDAGDQRNYDGTLADALASAFRIGSTGCGFEQPLHAARLAGFVNTESNFWRTDASRAVVVLTDEDDCSIRDSHVLEDDPELGPLTSFRCTKYGVVCDQSIDEIGGKTNCRPRVDSYIEDPAMTKQGLEFPEQGPERVTFSAIAGPPTPFAVEQRQINGMAQLGLSHSCSLTTPTGPQVADPAPRIASLADSFQSRGGFYSICDADYGPSLRRIGTTIKRSLGIACIDRSWETCRVRDVRDRVERYLPPCPAEGDCFDVVDDPAACGTDRRVVIDRKTTPSAATRVDVLCEPISP